MRSLNQLQDLIDDTTLAVGSEAFASTLQVYNYAKASGEGTGVETLVVDMGQRFVRKHRKPKSQEATS